MDQILVTIIGIVLIVFIYWFFFGRKDETLAKEVVRKDNNGNLRVEIIVDGGYKPAVIFLEKGKKTTLNIIRKDQSTCLSDIIIPDFKLSKYLPLNKEVKVEINTDKEGEFPFHCGMNMFHGKIVIT